MSRGEDLSLRQRAELVDALVQMDRLHERHRRETIATELRRELGISVSTTDDVRYDLLAMVNKCGEQKGGLHVLRAIIQILEAGERGLSAFSGLVDRFVPDPVLRVGERRRLEEIASSVDESSLRDAVEDATGSVPIPFTVDRQRRLIELIELLEEAPPPHPRAVPPLVAFLTRLARLVGEEEADVVQTLWTVVLERLGLPSAGSAARAPRPDPGSGPAAPEPERTAAVEAPPRIAGSGPDPSGSFLVIQVEPDPVSDEQFQVSGWVEHSAGGGEMLQVDERPWAWDEVQIQVDRVFQELARRVGLRLGPLTVEMVLPWSCLGQPVDQWPIQEGQARPRIGAVYPLVVRSWERSNNPVLQDRLQSRWERLRSMGTQPPPGASRWIHQPGAVPLEPLLIDLLGSEEAVVMIGAAPMDVPPGEFDVGLHAGLPALLWCRGEEPLDERETDLRRLLREGPLRLPEAVHRLRRQAARQQSPPGHLGLHITLVWDDADRMPARHLQRLAPPAAP